jgi:hypothetical protein
VAAYDPLKLSSFASLNRTRLAHVAAIDPPLRGQPAVSLLSAAALRQSIAAEAGRLGLEAQLAGGEDVLPAFDRCLASPDEGVRAVAVELGVRFGAYLGQLLISLAGTPSSAGPEGDLAAAYRAHWSRVRHVVLGGGVVSGNLGRVMREVAREIVRTSVAPEFRLEVHDYAAQMPLIGAALGVKDGSAALAYDFGGSVVKRGVALYEDGALTEMRLLPMVALPPAPPPGAARGAAARATGEAMSRLIAEGRREALSSGFALGREVACAVNGYFEAAEPTDLYSAIRLIDGSSDWLSDAVSSATGEAVYVSLAHDGTAAARCLAGMPDAAAIMLGTYLGAGFPPPAGAVRRLSQRFAVLR